MKYTLTISDLTAEEVTAFLNRSAASENQDVQVSATGAPEAPAAPVAPQQPASNMKLIQPSIEVDTGNESQQDQNLELDANGHPWDARIHAKTKTQKADGTWKRKRGLSDAEFDAVVAEFETNIAPEAPAAPVAPQQPASPIAVVAPIAAPEPKIERNFEGFMKTLSNLFANKQVTQDYPPTIVQRINTGFVDQPDISALTDIENNPQMVEYAWQCLEIDEKV